MKINKLITGSARLNLAIAMMFGAQMASNHVFQDKQTPRPSKTPNNNLRLKAEAKRQRKMARNKAVNAPKLGTYIHDDDEIMSIILSAALCSNGCVTGSVDNGVLMIKEVE